MKQSFGRLGLSNRWGVFEPTNLMSGGFYPTISPLLPTPHPTKKEQKNENRKTINKQD